MPEIGYLRGNQAAALAAKLSHIEFMGAYPNPPSSEIMEGVRAYIQRGELKSAFIEAEGEDQAQLACFAAACAGCRAFNATSSQGLLYMHQSLPMMAGNRMPMVMVIGTRSVFSPHGMQGDHTDAISQRDVGWLQLYCETVQEVLDTVIQAFKIGENPDIKLPVMVCEDGYYTTHSLERVVIPDQKDVDAFLPPYQPSEVDHLEPGGLPMFTSFGIMENWYTEFKYQHMQAIERAKAVIEKVDDEFGEIFGRKYNGLLEPYLVEDAEVVLVVMGGTASTARFAISIMRKAGKKVGLIKLRSFRPFPKEKLSQVISRSQAKVVVVIERIMASAVLDEVKSALYSLDQRPMVMGFICGLNGRDIAPYNIIDLAEQGLDAARKGFIDKEQQMYMVRKMDFFAEEVRGAKEI